MESKRATDTQIGGNHYREMAIQPSEFIQRNGLNWCEGNIIKYLCRHRNKNGAQDVQKAIHYAELLLEWEYSGMTKTAADYAPLAPEEIQAINSSISPPSLCGTCIRQNCPVDCAEHTTECVNYLAPKEGAAGVEDVPCHSCRDVGPCMSSLKWEEGGCDGYSPEQSPLKDTPTPLSLALPSITVEGDLDAVRKKYEEELDEWSNTADGSMEELIEAWDVIQVMQTYRERGGKSGLHGFPPNMDEYYKKYPDRTLAAKRATLIKNAARFYYSPEVNERIILSGGKEW